MNLLKQASLGSVLLLVVSCVHNPEFQTHEGVESAVALDVDGKTKDLNTAFDPYDVPPGMTSITPLKSLIPAGKGASPHHLNDIFYVPEYGEPLVQKWVDYFLGNGRPHMEKYLSRLPRYESLMKSILVKEGLPPELIYIALIESGFNSTAYSRARAVGYWQFIRGTGRAYGLKQNWLVDERRDPILSTEAAAKYFKALYKVFGSWHLAMCSYNAGENRVLRAVMNNLSRDFWELHSRRQLPKETLNYVPKFVAAAMIANNPKKYGFDVRDREEPFSYDEVKVRKGVSLSKLSSQLGISKREIKRLNPIFKTDFAPVYRGSNLKLRVPVGMGGAKAIAAAKASTSTKKYVASEGTRYHRVRRGDSLYKIALRYKTSVSKLKRINGISGRSVIRPGRKIWLPGSKRPRKSRGSNVAKASIGSKGTYQVKQGDSLWTISRKFGVSIRNLKRWNNLRSSRLKIGQVLRVLQGNVGGRKPSKSSVYYVKRGDNLTNIARKYGVRLTDLLRHNGLKSSSKLLVGMKIRIP